MIGHLLCSSLKFIAAASHLNLLFLCFELIFTWYATTFHCFVILKLFGTVKGGCIPSKNKFKTQINDKLRWLASDINFKLQHTGFPIADGKTGKDS